MPDTNSYESPPVQDKRTSPPGILPRNTQAWILAGPAFLMVAVIWLSGRNQPKERSAPKPSAAAVVDPNTARIQEYQKRIEEQAQRLRVEQAQLAQTQQTLRPLPPSAAGARPAPEVVASRYPSVSPQEDSIQAEERKREYRSRFASDIALSYRKDTPNSATSASPTFTPEFPRPLLPYSYPYALPIPESGTISPPASSSQVSAPVSPRPEAAGTARDNAEATEEHSMKKARSYQELQLSEGKPYRLFEGTVIETVLTNRLDGTFSGPVNCMATANVYTHDGQHVLIPQGSRILGEVRKVQTFGDQRLAVFFHRLIMPDGYSVSLDKFQGLSQIGETGLRDQVNHHYLQIFGASLAIGAIAGLSQINTGYGFNESAADAYRQGVTASLSQSSLHILDRFLNVLPTFTIREGHRVKIYLSEDLLISAYENHQMPSDL